MNNRNIHNHGTPKRVADNSHSVPFSSKLFHWLFPYIMVILLSLLVAVFEFSIRVIAMMPIHYQVSIVIIVLTLFFASWITGYLDKILNMFFRIDRCINARGNIDA